MIYVISKATFGSYDVRDIQCNANWDCCPYSDYALIPDNLVEGILATQGYCDITLNADGTEVTGFTARSIPPVPEECCGTNTVLSVNGVKADTSGAVSLTAADVGAAPAGFGLGETAKCPTRDANSLTATGWYYADINTPDSNWWYGQHIQYDTGYAYQKFTRSDDFLTAERKQIAGIWSEWADVSKSAFAPAGFGLGENLPADIDHLALANRTGWFRSNQEVVSFGLTPGWWFGNYIPYGDNEGVWELNHYLDGLKANIRKVNGVLQPAEWVNPPMVTGEEYRTTERYKGNPVYVKLVDYGLQHIGGNLGLSDIAIPHGISGFKELVRCDAKCAIYPLPGDAMVGTNFAHTSVVKVDTTNVTLRIINEEWNNAPFEFAIYYTKE